jgi:hypothetical protein
VMAVSADLSPSAGDSRLDPLFQLVWRSRHKLKPSARGADAILAEA